MPMGYAQLISRQGTSAPVTVPLGLFALVANLSSVDRHLKKAGLPEMTPFFESDDDTWLPTADVLRALDGARRFFAGPPEDGDGHLWEAVAEQLDSAIKVLLVLPNGSVIRLEIITPKKTRKPAKPKPAPAAASIPVKMKLPKNKASDVAEAMLNEVTQAKLSFQEFIAYWMQYDASEGIANTRVNYPKLMKKGPERWLELKYRFESICDYPTGWYLRAIPRRAATGNLDEFGRFIQMQVRQMVLFQCVHGSSYTHIFELLLALAIGDDPAIERFLKTATFPESGRDKFSTIYNGVHALLREDAAEIDRLRKTKISKSTPTWAKGQVHCLQGIAERDASRVAAGIDEHLDGFYKAGWIDPMEKILSLQAHGMYRLAERIDPKLVRKFNTERDLPWDREFHAWSNGRVPKLAVEHFGDCPADLCAPFVTLEIPPWLHCRE
jgi:hypothetical protein